MIDPAKEAWLDLRDKGITGTDIGVILGVSKWMTPTTLAATKKHLIPREDVETEAMRIGKALEPWMASQYEERTGLSVAALRLPGSVMPLSPRPWLLLSRTSDPWMLASPDGFVYPKLPDEGHQPADKPIRGVEFKISSQMHEWGEDGSDEVPEAYMLQCQWYMAVTGLAHWDLFALLGGRALRLYPLTADAGLQESMIKIGRAWFERYVLGPDLPEPGAGDGAVLAALHTDPSKEMLDADAEIDGWCRWYRTFAEQEKTNKEAKDDLASKIKARIGNNLGFLGSDFKVTWIPTKESSYTTVRKATRMLRVTFAKDKETET